MNAALWLAVQVFLFVGHDCPTGYERLIKPPASVFKNGGTWKDFEITMMEEEEEGQSALTMPTYKVKRQIELVFCIKPKVKR